ncbi:MAG: hypothetical protein RJB66_2322 [Pseudomonadota bacterium]|jgi:hypothetical protein
MSLEKSAAPRLSLAMSVEFRKSYSRQMSSGTLRNISLSGAFLDTSTESLMSGDKLQIVLNVGARVRKVSAEIVWKNQKGVGLKFNHSNNRDLQIVDDLMYFAENKRETQKDLLGDIFDKVS